MLRRIFCVGVTGGEIVAVVWGVFVVKDKNVAEIPIRPGRFVSKFRQLQVIDLVS